MNKIRGYATYNSTIEEVKEAFKNFQELNIYFISNGYPGILIDDEVTEDLPNEEILKKITILPTKKIDLEIENKESLNRIQQIKNNKISGNYFGFKINPPYDYEKIIEKASNFEMDNVVVRNDEKTKEGTKLCIELIGNFEKEQVIEKAKEMGGEDFFSFKILD